VTRSREHPEVRLAPALRADLSADRIGALRLRVQLQAPRPGVSSADHSLKVRAAQDAERGRAELPSRLTLVSCGFAPRALHLLPLFFHPQRAALWLPCQTESEKGNDDSSVHCSMLATRACGNARDTRHHARPIARSNRVHELLASQLLTDTVPRTPTRNRHRPSVKSHSAGT